MLKQEDKAGSLGCGIRESRRIVEKWLHGGYFAVGFLLIGFSGRHFGSIATPLNSTYADRQPRQAAADEKMRHLLSADVEGYGAVQIGLARNKTSSVRPGGS